MRELEKVLDVNEKILWEGVPVFWPFFLSRSIVPTIVGIFWMGFMSIFILAAFSTPGPFKYAIFLMPHFWIGIGLLFGPSIYNALVYKHTYYAITDKRAIFQGGVIGRDFKIVDFDQVTNAEVNVGVFDKLLNKNTGSVFISTAGSVVYTKNGATQKPYTICNVENPYEVFKYFKKVEFDVKSDIEFPNKLRPSENPGYGTTYEGEKLS